MLIARDPNIDDAVVRTYRVTGVEQGRTPVGDAYALFYTEAGAMVLAVGDSVTPVADEKAAKGFLENIVTGEDGRRRLDLTIASELQYDIEWARDDGDEDGRLSGTALAPITLAATAPAPVIFSPPFPSSAAGRIVGGGVAPQCAHGWMAHLSMGCGGSLIGPRHVLTAAHCCAGFNAEEITVRVNRWNMALPEDEDCEGAAALSVSTVHMHPLYNGGTLTHDACVLELASSAPVDPSSLPSLADARPGASSSGYSSRALPPGSGAQAKLILHSNARSSSVGKYIVKLRGASRASRFSSAESICTGDNAAGRSGAIISCPDGPNDVLGFLVVEGTRGDIERASQLLGDLAESIESDEPVYVDPIMESGRNVVDNWGLDSLDGVDDGTFNIAAGLDGTGSHIFIVDTGVREDHEEWAGRFGTSSDYTGEGAGFDGNGHGTHCAGIAAGNTYGPAKGATVHGVKVLTSGGSGTWTGVLNGMNHVVEYKQSVGADVPVIMSMSLGGGSNTAINEAVATATAAGVIVSVAAGNDNGNACSKSPAGAPEAITVGSTQEGDGRR